MCITQDRFGIELQKSWVVELDSSSATKFSRHVIIQIPGAAFRSSFHVGAFVKDLCEVPGGAKHPEGKTVPRQELLVAKARSMHELFAVRMRLPFGRLCACHALKSSCSCRSEFVLVCIVCMGCLGYGSIYLPSLPLFSSCMNDATWDVQLTLNLMHMQDAEGGQTLFVDGGVYTRNRAFRLFLSSKAGKDAVLQPTGRPSSLLLL